MAKKAVPIQNLILEIRGQKVMLDSDLARLYGVELRALNQAVKRNLERFPKDFMFQLKQKEWEILRSQIVISSLPHGGRRYVPFVFTEQGVSMLSSVLNSKHAIKINIQIIRAFVKLRHYVLTQKNINDQIAGLHKLLMLHIENSGNKFAEYDDAINNIVKVLNNFLEKKPKTKRIGFSVN